MTATTLLLQLNGLTLDLNDPDDTGFIISTIDLGFAQPRVVADSLPGQDGQFDQTAYFDTRTIQLTGAVVPTLTGTIKSRSAAMDALAPFIAPGARPTLVYALDDDMTERCLDLRVNQWTNPINHPTNATQFAVQWVCPNPIAYDATVNEVGVPFATGSTTGRSYPRSYPLSYPGGGPVGGEAFVTSDGTYPTWPTLRIFGPCTGPAVFWLDPTLLTSLGIQVVFQSDFVINDGDYVEVDTLAKTALLNGDSMASRYNFLDFGATTWGRLQPGLNLLRFNPAMASTDSLVEVLWRDSFLS